MVSRGHGPECVDALLAKARVLLRAGESDDARVHVISVLRRNAVDHDALRMLVMIRARKNPAQGLLMRWNLWLEFMEPSQNVAWLVGAFVVARVSVQVATDLGWHTLAATVNALWYACVGYTWIAPFFLRQMLKRERADIDLDDDY